MNHEKAREFFSAYYEGTLEEGLKQNFEQRLASDAQIQAEYRAFESTMNELTKLQLEEIDVPIYLSDRIASRLEQGLEHRRKSSIFSLWLPRFALGAVAVAVMYGGVLALRPGNSNSSQGGIATSGAESNPMKFEVKDSNVVFEAKYPQPKTITVSDEKGHVLKTISLAANQDLKSPLSNPNTTAALFQIQVSDENPPIWLAIPGSGTLEKKANSGSIKELAMALADRYKMNVEVKVNESDKTLTWNLQSNSPIEGANSATNGSSYTVSVSADNMFIILDR